MPKIQTKCFAEMEDGEVLAVVADQRDYAAFEATELQGPQTLARYIAWSAATRAGLYKKPWERFNTRECVEVLAPDGDDAGGEGGDGLDPGRSDQSAGA